MPARRAFPFIYYRLVSLLTEEGKVRVNALLGDPAAIEERRSMNLELLADMDAEVG
jgi:hypothetical protein